MGPDLHSAELTKFLQQALGIQLEEPERPLSEERLKEIALKAGLTEEDWDNLTEKLKGHLARGRNFLKFDNFSDAVAELEHAAAIAPYRADVLLDGGKAHFGRWKETEQRSSRDRAEFLFTRCLALDPDSEGAAEQLSGLRKSKPLRKRRRLLAMAAACFVMVGGVSAWVGIPGLSGTRDSPAGRSGTEAGSPGGDARTVYQPATLPDPGSHGTHSFDRNLVAHWTFDRDDPGADRATGRHSLTISGRVETVEGVEGRAMRFFNREKSGMYSSPSEEFRFDDSITVSAWVKPATWKSSQIVWFGDRRGGRDPWQLAILDSGQVRFRSDRSVTGDPPFTMLPEEIIVKPGDAPHLNQHVQADAPGVLPLNEWSFVAGRIRKTPSGECIITVFVNGTAVGEAKTTETVDYATDAMWITVGGIHDGNAQNFNGIIDEVRVYRGALSDDEIGELYGPPLGNDSKAGDNTGP